MNLRGEERCPEHQACVQGPPRDSPLYAPKSIVAQDWPLSCSINQTDQMLAHLQSFSSVPEHFTLPDSTKSGVPLFYIPPGSTTPVSALISLPPFCAHPLKSRAPNQNLLTLRAILLPPSQALGKEEDL